MLTESEDAPLVGLALGVTAEGAMEAQTGDGSATAAAGNGHGAGVLTAGTPTLQPSTWSEGHGEH
jgi:hypothetical protein